MQFLNAKIGGTYSYHWAWKCKFRFLVLLNFRSGIKIKIKEVRSAGFCFTLHLDKLLSPVFRRYIIIVCIIIVLSYFQALLQYCVMSVRPSTWNNSPLSERILMRFCIFLKSVEKIQVSSKSDKNTSYLRNIKTNIRFWSYLAKFFLEWEMFQTKL